MMRHMLCYCTVVLAVAAAAVASAAEANAQSHQQPAPPPAAASQAMSVERALCNWPLQVSLAARLAAAPPGTVVVALDCDWPLWGHPALDAAARVPLLCLSRRCGRLRAQRIALAARRPAWAFHCITQLQGAAAGVSGSKTINTTTTTTTANAQTKAADSNNKTQAKQQQKKQQQRQRRRRQALGGLSDADVDALAANASVLVVGLQAGAGARLMPTAMAALTRPMTRLAQVDVVVAADRGARVERLAVIEAPMRRARVLANPANRFRLAQGDGSGNDDETLADAAVYPAAFWQAERAAVSNPAATAAGASRLSPLQARAGAALAKLGARTFVDAYAGARPWLPAVVARLAADATARESLAALQRRVRRGSAKASGVGGRGGNGSGGGPGTPLVGAETATLGDAATIESAQGNNSTSNGTSSNGGFHYFGLDAACDRAQSRRSELGAGDHWVRPPPLLLQAQPPPEPDAAGAHQPNKHRRRRLRRPLPPPGARGVTWRSECADAAHEGLPRGADVVATRGTLEYLPLESAYEFLSAVKASGARWLLLGGFAGGAAPNREPEPGVSGYYAFDPTQPPFNLRPPPLETFYEDGDEAGEEGRGGGGSSSVDNQRHRMRAAVGGMMRGAAARAAAEAARAGRRVVRLYDARALTWDDGLYGLFNVTRPAAGPAEPRQQPRPRQ